MSLHTKNSGFSTNVRSVDFSRHPWNFSRLLHELEGRRTDVQREAIGIVNAVASLSNKTVRKLLCKALNRGLDQHVFEQISGRLRPNLATPTRLHGGVKVESKEMRGRLWWHYMNEQSSARMSCITFAEYVHALHEGGYLSDKDARRFTLIALNVFVGVRGQGNPLEQFVREFLRRKFEGISPRFIGAFLKNAKRQFSSIEDYEGWLQDFPAYLNGLESLGKKKMSSSLSSELSASDLSGAVCCTRSKQDG